MRALFVIIHRWFGLAAAVFLFISGATGAVISWDHELDAWLNPGLFQANSAGQPGAGAPKGGLELANLVEQAEPRLRVTYVLTQGEPGHTIGMMVEPRIDPASGKPYALDYNQIAVDPVTAEIQGRRMWGAVSLSRENLLPFLYKLHYTMHLPDMGGIETGVWLMGIIGIVWTLDCFIALYLSFPNWRSWRKSFAFRWRDGGHKLNFDLHRSGGVWVWALLLVLAVTSVSMNLERQVMRPILQTVSTLTPGPFDTRTPVAPEKAVEPRISREQAVALGRQEGSKQGLAEPVGGVFYSSMFGVYGVGFFQAGNDHGDGGLGNAWLYFDSNTGAYAGGRVPGNGSAGDIFLQAQFPLHSGRILGLPGRILISFMGALVAMLSVTGVVIWVRKRKARIQQRARLEPAVQAMAKPR
ncbi:MULTISPECIES: PepSY domain-containing protein [unclassified Herbaspirillum]|uniref:PepSY-associated TM helix domain-containing protein n=1 Tax=unclassified Herbaspirillum TaxID=2624150 RepID=UPI001152A975|nr:MULTISPECIES: PepSY-associated TM helix domain-containing protein [unclassified Herbaspirillum]MBB5393300.1 putative iron-regulated membrane protein [Herbaspirillum sp. SJZ102]TQK03951.1 putative iron-regulated membrane protein [Herbaspirillum sp. SJZ130]TQK08683.1 putative iron-regulated membrane protein [Herbaspirillum sp. SJZ106]TWC71954.1 putative iron-regulated membrane protein [Herbaspirillum sp. SJZ099]